MKAWKCQYSEMISNRISEMNYLWSPTSDIISNINGTSDIISHTNSEKGCLNFCLNFFSEFALPSFHTYEPCKEQELHSSKHYRDSRVS